MKNLAVLVLSLGLAFTLVDSSYAQVKHTEICGLVTTIDSIPLPRATVIAIHVPSDSQFGAMTDQEGSYRLPDLNTGGPYSIKVTLEGYETFWQRDIYLTLGKPMLIDVQLKPAKVKNKWKGLPRKPERSLPD